MLAIVVSAVVGLIGRTVAPLLAGSLPLLLLFVGTFALFGAALALAVGVVNFSMFALVLTRLYLRTGGRQTSASTIANYASEGPGRLSGALVRESWPWRYSPRSGLPLPGSW